MLLGPFGSSVIGWSADEQLLWTRFKSLKQYPDEIKKKLISLKLYKSEIIETEQTSKKSEIIETIPEIDIIDISPGSNRKDIIEIGRGSISLNYRKVQIEMISLKYRKRNFRIQGHSGKI